MPTFDRTTIVRGPCKIGYDGATFYSKGGVVLTQTNSTFDKETDAYGMVSKAKTDLQIVCEFEPVGEIESLTVLFAHSNTAMGASIYGATDKPLVITAADGTYTVLNAQITQTSAQLLTGRRSSPRLTPQHLADLFPSCQNKDLKYHSICRSTQS